MNARIDDAHLGQKMNSRPYQICSNCIMDTSDSNIVFDERGQCDYCNNYYSNVLPNWHTGERGEAELRGIVEKIKEAGRGQPHDCIVGISGGIDSSYMTYLAKEKFGLRPLLFHVDAGWNSQQAVHNIERLVDALELDLHTEVVNWPEMQDLQLAFFKAQVPNLDIPQDHVFGAALYNYAAKNGIKYILNGGNYSTECVREPLEWAYHASDLTHIRDVHRRFGTRPLTTLPTADIFKYKIYYRYVKGVTVVRPLNYVPFVKDEVVQFLVDTFGWQRYAHKHYESRFTRFFEGWWQLHKFGFDKRRTHFSSLILTKQMTRDAALETIAKPPYDPELAKQDFEFVANKLDITVDELQAIFDGPNRKHSDYRTASSLIGLGTIAMRALGMQRSIIR